jgi:hypothetical protein
MRRSPMVCLFKYQHLAQTGMYSGMFSWAAK